MLPAWVLGVTVPAVTFVLLTAVGCDLRVSDLRRVWRRPGVVAVGLVFPPLVLPALALGLTAWLSPPPSIASGLLLIAICPIGGLSNTLTYLARGSTALSVTLTALSCAFAIVTVPALGEFLEHVAHGPSIGTLPPALLLLQLVVAVVLPVALGMLVRHRWPAFADQHHATMQRTAFVLLAMLLALIVLADTRSFVAGLPDAVPLSASFIACSFLVGGGAGHVLGGDIGERIALAIEFATRNVAVATTLAVTVGRIELATFTTTYFLTELPMMLIAVVVLRRLAARSRRAAVSQAEAVATRAVCNPAGATHGVPVSRPAEVADRR